MKTRESKEEATLTIAAKGKSSDTHLKGERERETVLSAQQILTSLIETLNEELKTRTKESEEQTLSTPSSSPVPSFARKERVLGSQIPLPPPPFPPEVWWIQCDQPLLLLSLSVCASVCLLLLLLFDSYREHDHQS